jgi:ribonuclease P protein component
MRGEEYITKPEQYARVYDKGSSWASQLVVVKALPNQLTLSRYGFSVSRRLGGAVVRNRVKRRLREILRALPLAAGWDIIFIARPKAAAASFADMEKTVRGLLSRAKILAREYEGACLRLN